MFAGGFDLESACAVAGPDHLDDYAILDVLDALVRKSLLVADRSSGRTRFSMLETIRQFGEEQLVASGAAEEVRTAQAHHFAGKEADILALWDSPRQREAYGWFTTELANLRTAFRWAADQGNLDIAATIATCAAFLGTSTEIYEPLAWVEELIEPARQVDHPRLTMLYVMASQCWTAGRIEAAIHYTEAGHALIRSRPDELPYVLGGFIGNAYVAIGQPERLIDWCRTLLARGNDTHTFTRSALGIALTNAGCSDEAMTVADGLVEAAEATANPLALCYALFTEGFAYRDADPDRAQNALRRGLVTARDSGNRANVTHFATVLCRHEVQYGDPLAALDYISLAIGNYHDSGNPVIAVVTGTLATLFERLGRREPAAIIAGFAFGPLTATVFPEFVTAIADLREALGDQTYQSLAHKGETMTMSAMATYAYDQIDQARAELNAVSK